MVKRLAEVALCQALALALATVATAQNIPLPPLPYDYNALEPHVDEATMRVHHLGHHATYTEKLNVILATLREDPTTKVLAKSGVDALIRNMDSVPASLRTGLRNNGGGFVNHEFFWSIMAPPSNGGGGQPTGGLLEAMQSQFGSFEAFQQAFTKVALDRFGSGWVWLYYSLKSQMLVVDSTPNQDSPMMTEADAAPIVALDLWEHAYYLKHQNKRAAYISAWWNVVNWGRASELFATIPVLKSEL